MRSGIRTSGRGGGVQIFQLYGKQEDLRKQMPLAAPTKSNQENSFIQTKVEAGEFWYKISSVFETKRKFRPKSVVTSQKWLNPVFKTLGQARCRAWDLVHGVDTCGEIPLLDLDFENEHKTPGLEYQSHHPAIIRDGLMSLNIPCQDYAFVDFGCGKGRVLLVASEFPFRRITGVEFAPQLADTAKRNLQTYRAKNQKCFELEVITADASEYELAHEPQVLYFYSPFARSVMDRVVRNIEASLQKSPRDLLILFSGVLGMRESAFGSRPQYERLKRGRYIDIYRHRRR